MLWDVDYTLVAADGLGTRLYEVVFREMFGRELTVVASKAGRTDRAIIGDTLALAGMPAAAVDPFLAALARAAEAGAVPERSGRWRARRPRSRRWPPRGSGSRCSPVTSSRWRS